MNKELDKKLLDILRRTLKEPIDRTEDGEWVSKLPEAIAQIKACFEEAGYSKSKAMWTTEPLMMTRQEFYERFEKEVNRAGILFKPGDTGTRCVQAVKRAAGLET